MTIKPCVDEYIYLKLKDGEVKVRVTRIFDDGRIQVKYQNNHDRAFDPKIIKFRPASKRGRNVIPFK